MSDAGVINGAGVEAAVKNSSGVNNPVNTLDKLEGVVAAAKLEAAAAQTTAPEQTPAETPKGQFENQFGSGPATPPVAETTAPSLIDTALSNLGTAPSAEDMSVAQPSVDSLTPEQTQPVVETLAQPEPEKTPADKLRQKVSDDIDAFLEEVTKEKIPA